MREEEERRGDKSKENQDGEEGSAHKVHVMQAWGGEFSPQDHIQKLGMAVYVCNPNAGELETSRSLELSS